jgi:hypothetical protein
MPKGTEPETTPHLKKNAAETEPHPYRTHKLQKFTDKKSINGIQIQTQAFNLLERVPYHLRQAHFILLDCIYFI